MKQKKINLGCGRYPLQDWINHDLHKTEPYVDVAWDLNKIPYPCKDDEFEMVNLSHVLEHLNDIIIALKELHRITKNGGIVKISVPYFNCAGNFLDVTHKHSFTWDSFTGFTTEEYSITNTLYFPKLFKYKSRKLVYGTSKKWYFNTFINLINFIINLNPRFMERHFPFLISIQFLEVKLIVVK